MEVIDIGYNLGTSNNFRESTPRPELHITAHISVGRGGSELNIPTQIPAWGG